MTATATPPASSTASAAAPNVGARRDTTVLPTLALTAVTVAVVVGFVRLFADGSFLVPLMATAVTGHAISWWGRRQDWPTALSAIATLAGVAVVATWTVLPETTFFGVPTRETLSIAGQQLSLARTAFRTAVAPAPVLDGFVLASVVGVALVAVMSDWAAFRIQTSFEACVPGFTLFLFTAALGTDRHRGLALVLFVGSALAFLLVSQLGRQTRTGTWFGGRAGTGPFWLVQAGAALGLVAVLAGLFVGPALPGADDEALLKYKNSNRPGPANRSTVSPLVDIRGRLVERADIEVFTVKSNQRAYWRLTSLDTFDGTIWSSNDKYRSADGRLRTDVQTAPDASEAVQEFALSALGSIWLPAAFRPERVSGVEGVAYNSDTGSLITDEDFADGLTYQVQSKIPVLGPEQLATAPAVAPNEILLGYGSEPPVSPRVRAEAARIVAGATTPYARAKALQDYFHRGFRYDLNASPGHGSAALERFLFRTRAGYCEQFAGSYAVMARLVGLPSRVAVGFTPGELQADGLYHVRDEHAHAWPEVYLHGFGWVAFEPTPGRGAPGAESYTGRPEQQDQAGSSTTATTVPNTPTTAPAENDLAPTTTSPEQNPDLSTAESADAADDDGPGRWAIVGLAMVVLLLLWLGGVPLLVRMRRNRLRAAAETSADRVVVAWDEASEALRQAGLPRRLAETPAEYAARAGRRADMPDDASVALRSLATDAAAAIFAGGDLPQEVATRAEGSARRVVESLRDRAGVREQLWWAVDPRQLLRRNDAVSRTAGAARSSSPGRDRPAA